MKKNLPTLRERVWQVSIGTFLITIVLLFTSFTLYSMKKAKLAEEHVMGELTSNIENQVSLFLPSFLLPEQKQGIELLLSRVKKSEELDEVRIINGHSDLDAKFSACQLSSDRLTRCTSKDQLLAAVITPLKESDEIYGYLFKSKKNVSPDYLKEVLQVAFLMIMVLGIVFAGVYLIISRLLSKTLPSALDNLVSWIESDLKGSNQSQIDLPFKELEDLKFKISEVLERYNSAREQAIIGQLTSGIMHDIKTPLQSIVSAMHLVDEQEMGTTKRLARLENSQLMNKLNLPAICNIIETTLDGSRSIRIDRAEQDILLTLENSLQLNFEIAQKRNVTISKNTPLVLLLAHDSVQLLRVFSNLVKNAIEAAGEGDSKKEVIISAEDSNETLKFIIEDSGAGIPGDPEKIFKAFQTTKVRGTGLGLIISKKIIEAHGGKLEAKNNSALGGAIFTIEIPKLAHEVSV